MREYSITLKQHDNGYEKGKKVEKLAKTLLYKVANFYSSDTDRNVNDLEKFKKDFTQCLHADDNSMRSHRAAWKPIIVNILLALTGLGAVALLVNAAYQATYRKPYAINHYLFWAQTQSELKIVEVDNQLKLLCI